MLEIEPEMTGRNISPIGIHRNWGQGQVVAHDFPWHMGWGSSWFHLEFKGQGKPSWCLVYTSHQQAMWLWAGWLLLLGLSSLPCKVRELDQVITEAHVLWLWVQFSPGFFRIQEDEWLWRGTLQRADYFLPIWQPVPTRYVTLATWLSLFSFQKCSLFSFLIHLFWLGYFLIQALGWAFSYFQRSNWILPSSFLLLFY